MGGSCHDALECPTTSRSQAGTGFVCVTNPGSSKQALSSQGGTPKRGHSPWLKYFLLQSPRRCVGVPVGLLGAAQRFRAGRSNPVAKPWVRAHAPTRNPWGWTAPALQMTWPSRALAAPGCHASMQGPAGRSRRWGPGCCGSPVRVGARTPIFASLGPP